MDVDLRLNAQALSQLCRKPELNYLGIMVLEQEIITGKEKMGQAKTKKKKVSKEDEGSLELWIRLTDLLRSAGEHENVTGIFMQDIKEMNNHPQTPEALNMEANQDWANALHVYRSLVENPDLAENHLDQEVSLWHKGYYTAHIKLAKWEGLSTALGRELKGNVMAAWESPHSGILIESLLTAGLHLSMENFEFNQNVHEFINKTLKDEAKKISLVNEHPLEIAVLFALKKRNVDAVMFARHGLETVRSKLFQDSSLLDRRGVDKLLELQALSEMTKYLTPSTTDLGGLGEEWMKLRPCLKDDLVAWDKILCVRNLYLFNEAESMMDTDSKENVTRENSLSLSLAKCFVSLAESAVAQSNVYFTHYSLKKIGHLMGASPEVAADRESIKSKVAILNFATRSDLTAVDNFCSVFRSSARHVKPEKGEEKKSWHFDFLHKDVVVCLSSIVQQNSHITLSLVKRQLKAEGDQRLFANMFQTQDSNEAFRRCLTDQAIQSFEKLRKLDWENHQQKLGSILLEGANYIYNLLQSGSEDVSKEALFDYHLNAMKAGNMTARQLFPRLLPVLADSEATTTGQFFVSCQADVPAWMFLAWSNQLISSLHNDQVNQFIFPLAIRIAEAYPNAIVYSVKICAENPDLTGPKVDLVARLKRQVTVSPVHRRVLQSLSLLTFPHIGLKDLVEGYTNWKQWYPDSWQEKFREECDRFFERFLSPGGSQGKLHQQFAKDYEAKIKGKDIKAMKSVLDTQASFEKKHYSNLLKDFTPFLASFQGSDFEDKIEIPGQYTGLSRPDPRKHAFISEFSPTVTIFSSIRKPMLIQVVGSDGRSYPFIVKAGEDLRQDQRIEQLFDICNRQLTSDDVGGGGGRIETYTVVPLTKRLGLIEFVPNTLPLRDFIHLVPQAKHQTDQATSSYFSGMQAITKEHAKQAAVAVGAMVFVQAPLVPDEAIVRNYNKAVDLVERFNLRSALVSISAGAEGFYYLRKNFISSYAVLSAVQWLLGKIKYVDFSSVADPDPRIQGC